MQMRGLYVTAVGFLLACSGPASPLSEGMASVGGTALLSNGEPLANSTVFVSCASSTVNSATDGRGHFLVGLTLRSDLMTSDDVVSDCLFRAPDTLMSRIHVSIPVHFRPAGVPQPLQAVTLREAP